MRNSPCRVLLPHLLIPEARPSLFRSAPACLLQPLAWSPGMVPGVDQRACFSKSPALTACLCAGHYTGFQVGSCGLLAKSQLSPLMQLPSSGASAGVAAGPCLTSESSTQIDACAPVMVPTGLPATCWPSLFPFCGTHPCFCCFLTDQKWLLRRGKAFGGPPQGR